MSVSKKRGRPAKPDRAPTVNLTLRLRPSLLDELRRSAQKSETSISAEAERRLSQPRVHDVARLVSLAVESVEQSAGKAWIEDEAIKRKCRAAAEYTLNLLLGPGADLKKLRSAIDFQMLLLEQVANGKTGLLTKAMGIPDKAAVREMLDVMSDFVEGQKVAADALDAALGASE